MLRYLRLKKILIVFAASALLSGCAQRELLISKKTFSPADSVLLYLDNLGHLKNKKELYSLLSSKNKRNISSRDFFQKAKKQQLFKATEILKSVLLDMEESNAYEVVVYLLLILSPHYAAAHKQCIVLKFHTVLERNEWKIYLKHKDVWGIDLFPVYLQLNKKTFDMTDLEIIRKLVKKDKLQKTKPKKMQSEAEKPREASKKTTAPNAQVIDKKLIVLEKCYQSGEELFKQKKYSEAIMQFQKVINIDPECFNAQAYIEKCQQELKK